jgi:hypothetical protein
MLTNTTPLLASASPTLTGSAVDPRKSTSVYPNQYGNFFLSTLLVSKYSDRGNPHFYRKEDYHPA